MATVRNTAYKIKVGRTDTLTGLVLEVGAMIWLNPTNELLYCDGLAWIPFTPSVSYSFGNGLTEVAGAVSLGGTLSQDTEILGSAGSFSLKGRQLSELDFEVGANLGAQPRSRIQLANDNQLLLQVEGAASQMQLSASNSSATFMLYDPSLRGFFFNLTTFQIYDQIANKGIEYNADYSANFTNESLITKRYVDAAIVSASLTFENGLNEAANVVKLGGALTQDTTIDGNSGTHELNLQELSDMILHVGATVGTFNRSQITMSSSELSLIRQPNTNVRADLSLTDALVTLAWTNVGQTKSLALNATQMLVQDQITSKGLEYPADYSAAWTDHSLITKKWSEDTFDPKVERVELMGSNITNTYTAATPSSPFEYFDTVAKTVGTAVSASVAGQSITINTAGNYRAEFHYVVQYNNQNDVDITIEILLNGSPFKTVNFNSPDQDWAHHMANYVDLPGLSATDVITHRWTMSKNVNSELHGTYTKFVKL